jgi:hypothetical protein
VKLTTIIALALLTATSANPKQPKKPRSAVQRIAFDVK